MTPRIKRFLPRTVGGLVVFLALAEWLLWLMPSPHGRLDYMVAGTAATAAALGAVFARALIHNSWTAHRRE